MNFSALFSNLKIPVIVCDNETLKVKHINTYAKVLLSLNSKTEFENLADVLQGESRADLDCMLQKLTSTGFVENFVLTLKVSGADKNASYAPIKINANVVKINERDDGEFLCFYLSDESGQTASGGFEFEAQFIKILSIACHSVNTDNTIEAILKLLGETLGTSYVTIFENVNLQIASATYDWQNDGFVTEVSRLQNIPIEYFNAISDMANLGVVAYSDISETEEPARTFLKSLNAKAVLTAAFSDETRPIGFVSCCDCVNNKQWTKAEIKFLLNVSFVISSLIMRKRAQTISETGFKIMERVLNNIEAMLYVVDINTHRVIYINNAMARERGIKNLDTEEVYCWQMFMRDTTKPCETCILNSLFDEYGNPLASVRREFQCTINNKWYSMTSQAVTWVNGEYVCLQTGVEITESKNNEDVLMKSASMDAMTNVYNREWGYKYLNAMILETLESDEANSSSVIFIDVDGLKFVNDNYDHTEGDKIIIGIVDALKRSTRKNDTIFRWGGDEFIVLLPGCTEENAEVIIKNCENILDKVNATSNKPYKYAFSYGIYEISNQGHCNADSVVKMADKLMFEQKRKKKASRES